MAVYGIRKICVLLTAVLFWQNVVLTFGSTHWVVTEEGLITQQVNSEFNLKEPYNLITFMKQEERSEEVHEFEKLLELQKAEIERNEDKDPDLEQRFLRTDPDCQKAGIALTDIDLYTKTVMSLENKGIRAVDHIDLQLANPKKFRRPNCTRILDLPFSMHSYDHLVAIQERKNLSSVAEPDLIYLLPADEGLDRIGHLIYRALMKNKTSWVLYNFASYFWRVHGNAEQVIDCARKALHFSPNMWKNVALLNMANALHRAHHSTDAAIIGEAALEGNQDLEVIYFMLGNIYAALGEYDKSIDRFQQALKLSPDLSVAEKRMYAVMCHKKLEAALESQHKSLQRTLAELRDYQVKQEHLQDLQQVVKKSRRNPDEQYESNLHFHHTKLLQGFAADTTNCELKDIGSGTHLYVCKQDPYPQGEVFGHPLETTVIEAVDTSSIHNNCIQLPTGEESCFNLSTGPSPQVGYNSYLSPPRHAPTMPWQSSEWPGNSACNQLTGEMPDWLEFSPTHLRPENKGLNATPTVTDYLLLGENEMMMLPWFSPVCVTVEPIEDGDTAMDYVEGIAQRTKLPLTDTLDSLKPVFLSYGSSEYINMDEMGHRVMTSLEENKEPNMKWMLFNLGGLYWQISGNNYHGVECLRRALYQTPIEYADIPLVNAASIMLRLKRPQDAIQLLRMALVVNSTEPVTHFTLGNALAAQKNYSQAAQQYKLALNFNPNYAKAQEALKIIKCHLKQPERLCPLETDPGKEYAHGVNTGHESGDVGKSMRTTEGNIQWRIQGAANSGSTESIKERKGEREEREKQRKSVEGTQNPPQAPSHGTGQMNRSGQMNTVEDPKNIIDKQVFSAPTLKPGPSGQRVILDIRDITDPPPSPVPYLALGPHIPAPQSPGIDWSELAYSTQLPWPSAEECQHFKKLNLRSFYSTWLSIAAKDASIEDYIDFNIPAGLVEVPLCNPFIGPSMHTMDHLEAMQHRQRLEFASEPALKDVLTNIGGKKFESVDDIGTRLAVAVLTYPESWVVYNVAGLFWRVRGYSGRALECLQDALHFSPRDKKDVALNSIANIFHAAGWLDDSIVVAKMAVEIAPELVVNHFTLANVYSAKGQFDKAIQYYESTLLLQPEFQPAIDRLKSIQCHVLHWMDQQSPSTPSKKKHK